MSFGWVSESGSDARVLPNGPGIENVARYANEAGDIYGWRNGLDRLYSVQMWHSGQRYEDLGHPASGGVQPKGTNNRGDLNLFRVSSTAIEDVRWADGTWFDLPYPPGTNEEWANNCISDEGWVFGNSAINDDVRAVFWRPGFGTQWLEDYVDDSKNGYAIRNIVACSRKNGLLTGWASKPGERFTRPILLVPYPKKSAGGQ